MLPASITRESCVATTNVDPAEATPASTSTSDIALGAVERRGRLVEDDELGLTGERAGDSETLLLAARQLAHAPTARGGEADGFEQPTDVDNRLARRPFALPRCPTHVPGSVVLVEQVLTWLGKHDPKTVAPQSRRPRRPSVITSVSPIFTLPSSGRCVHASSDNSVDFPEPEGPATTVIPPNWIFEVDVVERGDHIAFDREAADDAADVGSQPVVAELISRELTRFHASPPWPVCA